MVRLTLHPVSIDDALYLNDFESTCYFPSAGSGDNAGRISLLKMVLGFARVEQTYDNRRSLELYSVVL